MLARIDGAIGGTTGALGVDIDENTLELESQSHGKQSENVECAQGDGAGDSNPLHGTRRLGLISPLRLEDFGSISPIASRNQNIAINSRS